MTCPKCGGPLFEMMVRRFSEKLDAADNHNWGSVSRTSTRTDFTDGRECRKCRTFYPA